jgi:sec-independent protein translocase protein TatB
MIDIAFSKLAIIGVAALVFIGPEKLPRVARMAGTLLGRAQRYINDVKSEVSREIELDELRKMHKDVEEAAGTVGASLKGKFDLAESEMSSIFDDVVRNDGERGAFEEAHSIGGTSPSAAWSDSATQNIAAKAKNFRQKRLVRTSALPAWYKQQTGRRARVLSGAGRVAKYRAGGNPTPSSFF